MSLTARDVMSTDVVTASPSMTVQELARLLAENRISGVPVVDYKGDLLGIVSEADILSRKRGEETVRAIMTTDVVAIGEKESVQEIACLLSMKRINRVPVVRQGRVVGIVSRTDIVKAMAGIMPERGEAE
ncbi:MAG TPA: CBS domain-containing protein [Armatimonadota bacterium]|nr:CBS domain-containing protein [Armatimonadota bacterium]